MRGALTAAQLEILEVVWDAGDAGATVAEIHAALAERREVARTTVLTQVRRLAQRGWLMRERERRGDRYRAACTRESAEKRIAGEFVDGFFGGSATDLVRSLLGARRIPPKELRRLRELLDADTRRRAK